MLEATCHCGAVRIQVPSAPEFIVDCNCSICRRNGALWAFYSNDVVKLQGHPENSTAYVWGPHTIRTMHCKFCGCATHWEAIDAADAGRIGVNTRNFDHATMRGIQVRRFDGAETWTYVD